MSRPSRLGRGRGWGTGRNDRRLAGRRAVGPRRLKERVEQATVRREQQHRSVVAEETLILFQLPEEGVELGVLGSGLVADLVRLGVGQAALADRLGLGDSSHFG